MEIAIMALPENGRPVRSDLVQIAVVGEEQNSNNAYLVPLVVIASAAAASLLFYGYKRKKGDKS